MMGAGTESKGVGMTAYAIIEAVEELFMDGLAALDDGGPLAFGDGDAGAGVGWFAGLLHEQAAGAGSDVLTIPAGAFVDLWALDGVAAEAIDVLDAAMFEEGAAGLTFGLEDLLGASSDPALEAGQFAFEMDGAEFGDLIEPPAEFAGALPGQFDFDGDFDGDGRAAPLPDVLDVAVPDAFGSEDGMADGLADLSALPVPGDEAFDFGAEGDLDVAVF